MDTEYMIFFDIETAENINKSNREAWIYKQEKEKKKGNELTDDKAALFPAFNKIVCIVAAEKVGGEYKKFSKRVDEDSDYTEKNLIEDFFCYCGQCPILCGHNIKGFDIPVIILRAAANGIKIPDFIKVAGKKPWEIIHVDTAEISQVGKGKCQSLDELCNILGVETPKDGIDGSETTYYWKEVEGGKDEVLRYCEKDVKALINCYTKMKKLNII